MNWDLLEILPVVIETCAKSRQRAQESAARAARLRAEAAEMRVQARHTRALLQAEIERARAWRRPM
jgi:hypothetical protein